jgi:hypothetical protein
MIFTKIPDIRTYFPCQECFYSFSNYLDNMYKRGFDNTNYEYNHCAKCKDFDIFKER